MPFLDHRGKPYLSTAIRSDITGRKAAEQRLREQAALASVGQMAAVVAQEVKNPLAGIKGVLQVLMARRPGGDPEHAVMSDVIERIDALNELIHDLLLFARARPLRVQPTDIAVLLQQTVDAVRRDPVGAHVTVVVYVPDPSPGGCGDRGSAGDRHGSLEIVAPAPRRNGVHLIGTSQGAPGQAARD